MVDPLADLVSVLKPSAPTSKLVSGAGDWQVTRSESGQPFYCVVLDGACRLQAEGGAPVLLQAGDFVLIPAARGFTMSGRTADRTGAAMADDSVHRLPGEIRHGRADGKADVRLLVGHCRFGAADSTLLVSLLPQQVLVQGQSRLTALVQMIADECRAGRPARDMVLARLIEVLLIEAFRSAGAMGDTPGLARALSDQRLAAAIARMHASPATQWTVTQLASEAALSRSTFFERFRAALGMAPMAYLHAWRMTLAKEMLAGGAVNTADVAQRVGYGSASAFSTAFIRHAGMAPARYAKGRR
jgi:AraC-like DNA-binding protein